MADTKNAKQTADNAPAVQWFEAKLKEAMSEIEDLYSKYRLSEALMTAFKLFTDEFSGWYLEMIKPAYQQPIDAETYKATLRFFDILMKILHPFMPFITEELWQVINSDDMEDCKSIMNQTLHLDAPTETDRRLLAQVEEMKQVVAGVRAIRNQKNIAPKEPLILELAEGTVLPLAILAAKMANLCEVKNVSEKSEGSMTFLVGTQEYAIPLGNLIDTDAEIKKMETEITRLEGFMAGIQKKLSNEKFVNNAPAQVVELERKKLSDAQTKIDALRQSISALKK